ncbi:MAG: hypothetical protein OEZ39_10555 [Gammaproteobacteria bacterium]|nr:hypothetical protein [Gammaproteobacteria bacterium]MDH5652283.1 hypothetical protein [Gammaproteobacteria bacterium]
MQQQLSNEDNLRLNVLLNQEVYAIRIDEGKMMVHGLTNKGEAKIKLNPNCRDDAYVRRVKETISSHVLGSPGGYPVYIKRWTRMGHARDNSLENLLKLGEPEAVVAVVHAKGLTDELARRAWWAMPSAENARRMLEKESVAGGSMGPELAAFLMEFLPFEEQARDIIESVRLVLQPGLISDAERHSLWERGQRKSVYRVGFMLAVPDDLPEPEPAHPQWENYREKLASLIAQDNIHAIQLDRILSSAGQTFLNTVEAVMKKPSNQDMVVMLLEAIRHYFTAIRPDDAGRRDMQTIEQDVEQYCTCNNGVLPETLHAVLEQAPDCDAQIKAMLKLACVGVDVVNPIFAQTDAIGTVMRRKLEPVTQPLLAQCAVLRS